ncbi:hypothetical protein HDU67_009845 [Dinochytrium kinnereticum]|nr:hypothetical protein HDU67_009845 [Dinochytrium kinnereticum]
MQVNKDGLSQSPAFVLHFDPGTLTMSAIAPSEVQVSYTELQLRKDTQRVILNAFQHLCKMDTIDMVPSQKIHRDRFIYALAGKVFTINAPHPIGGKRRPGFFAFKGQNPIEAVEWIVEQAVLLPVRGRGRRRAIPPGGVLKYVAEAVTRIGVCHRDGIKDELDDAVLKGMTRTQHFDPENGRAVIPEHLRGYGRSKIESSSSCSAANELNNKIDSGRLADLARPSSKRLSSPEDNMGDAIKKRRGEASDPGATLYSDWYFYNQKQYGPHHTKDVYRHHPYGVNDAYNYHSWPEALSSPSDWVAGPHRRSYDPMQLTRFPQGPPSSNLFPPPNLPLPPPHLSDEAPTFHDTHFALRQYHPHPIRPHLDQDPRWARFPWPYKPDSHTASTESASTRSDHSSAASDAVVMPSRGHATWVELEPCSPRGWSHTGNYVGFTGGPCSPRGSSHTGNHVGLTGGMFAAPSREPVGSSACEKRLEYPPVFGGKGGWECGTAMHGGRMGDHGAGELSAFRGWRDY